MEGLVAEAEGRSARGAVARVAMAGAPPPRNVRAPSAAAMEGRDFARDGAVGAVRRLFVGRVLARRGEIEETILARIRDVRFDPTGGEDPEYVAGLRAATTAVIDHVLAGIERASGGSPEPVPAAAIEQARRAARVGVGLDTVLRRYVAGYAVLEDFVMEEVERDDRPSRGEALREILAGARALVERLLVAVTAAYDQEIERAGRRDRAHGGTVGARGSPPRERILRATVEIVAERGIVGATVKLVIARAGVSSRTFYEQFDGLDDCVVEVMDRTLVQVNELALRAFDWQGSLLDGMRGALAAVLTFFDAEPQLARVCLVETLRGGPTVQAARQRVLERFRAAVVAQIEREVSHPSPLAAEGVLALVMGIAYERLRATPSGSLIETLGPLMGLITGLVEDMETAAEQVRRGEELARSIEVAACAFTDVTAPRAGGTETDLPAVLGNPPARRARECLLYLAEHPGASNREIAAGIGVAHQSQISRLLSDLSDADLVDRHSQGAGRCNAWQLTCRGEEISHALRNLANRL